MFLQKVLETKRSTKKKEPLIEIAANWKRPALARRLQGGRMMTFFSTIQRPASTDLSEGWRGYALLVRVILSL